MKVLRILVLVLMALASFQTLARQVVPAVNYESPVGPDATGKPRTDEQIKQAIFRAAGVKQWTLKETAPGVMLATLQVRNKHTVVTEIVYSAEKYTLTLKESDNMHQGLDKDGKAVIHPYYNRWAQDLNQEIRLALSRT